ncbi:MAG: two-component system response regulator [Desulfobacterales bacterium]|nr:two-component system response regulator [Desulfobacterales bacterium]
MEKPKKILVVDDLDFNRDILNGMLTPLGYNVDMAVDGEDALNKVKSNPPDLILLDIMMPGLDGIEVAKRLKSNESTRFIPIVMVTALSDIQDRVNALESGADDFLTKPVDRLELKARVRSLLKVKDYNDHMLNYQAKLEEEVSKRTEQLKVAFDKIKISSLDVILRLSKAAEYKDEQTGAHIKRMSNYMGVIAKEMGLNDKVSEALIYAAPMHDVGKIGIPDRILLKKGPLSPEEWVLMKKHAIFGAQILEGASNSFVKLGEIIALMHHEKWDGSGYPYGLKAREIPLAGRIAAIADVFDALISRRPYKEPFPLDKSFEIIWEGKGKHFDPNVVEAFFAVQDKIIAIKEQYKDKEESLFIQLAKED